MKPKVTIRKFNPNSIAPATHLVKLHEAAKASINKHGVRNHVPPAKFTNSPPKPQFSIIPSVEAYDISSFIAAVG